MKSLALFTVLFSNSFVAFADVVKPVTVDLACTNTSDERVVYIVSNFLRSRLMVNAQIVYEGSQLIAGTEGGPAYMQVVGGGYNVTVTGGDLVKAFENSSTVVNGEADVSIWNADSNKSVEGTCKGLFSFDQK